MTSDGTWSYAWEHGRELASMTSGGTTWRFTYDANGMRTARTNGSTAYTYVYNGSQLSQMTVAGNTLNFTYDASGSPMSVTYGGATYYYVTNLQGDVVAILNASGTPVVTYTYDAWDKLLATSESMASTLGVHNPLRYRGYVYDTESGLYYLQSRYYDPEMGRFINADAFASTGQGVIGNNMFTYCLNNPVSNTDHAGTYSFAYYIDDPFSWMHMQYGGGGTAAAEALTIVLGVAVGTAIGMVVVDTASRPAEEEKDAKDEAVSITQTAGSRHQEYFPSNPLDFAPQGLVPKVYVNIGEGKGGIIKWEIPGTAIAIFEWNEDFLNGPHYHVMHETWKNKHLDPHHYRAGDPVPEPWNTLFFGYKNG